MILHINVSRETLIGKNNDKQIRVVMCMNIVDNDKKVEKQMHRCFT